MRIANRPISPDSIIMTTVMMLFVMGMILTCGFCRSEGKKLPAVTPKDYGRQNERNLAPHSEDIQAPCNF